MTRFCAKSVCAMACAIFVNPGIATAADYNDRSFVPRYANVTKVDEYKLGDFRVAVSSEFLRVLRSGANEDVILDLDLAHEWLSLGTAHLDVGWRHGSFDFKTKVDMTCAPISDQVAINVVDDRVEVAWQLRGSKSLCAGRRVTLSFALASTARLGFALSSDVVGVDFFTLTARSDPGETFHGFGLQPTYLNLKGHLVPIWPQEQGVGRGRQPYSWLVNQAAPGSAGSPLTTYMAAPYFITNKHRGLFLKNRDYAEIDLTQPSSLKIGVFASQVSGELIGADDPKKLVSAFTEYSGRMHGVPEWFHNGALLGLQGGTARVRNIWEKIRALGTPVAGLWLQDWVGQRRTVFGQQLWWNWDLDAQLYPEWDRLVAELRSQNVRVLGYLNPHLASPDSSRRGGAQRDLYSEARSHDFLVKDLAGDDYVIKLGSIKSGMIDLANPAARSWFKSVIKEQVIARGFSGWMCDFSEALPPDSQLYGGRVGREFHNDYIEEWAKVNLEAIEEAGLDDEAVYFCRSGYTRSPGSSRFFWQGDQTVTWDRFDGLQSALIGLIGGGISGYTLNHSDIGGYTGLNLGTIGLSRGTELLQRWEEFSAFTPAFRTHEGLRPEANAQIYDNDKSLAAFDRNARIFASLHFYRNKLFAEAESQGYPVARAMFLEFPDDPKAYSVDDQFMLGSEILVAPVVESQRERRDVYLPAGTWVHIWSGQLYGNPNASSQISVEAPLGFPPAFYRAGSAIGIEWDKRLVELGVKK